MDAQIPPGQIPPPLARVCALMRDLTDTIENLPAPVAGNITMEQLAAELRASEARTQIAFRQEFRQALREALEQSEARSQAALEQSLREMNSFLLIRLKNALGNMSSALSYPPLPAIDLARAMALAPTKASLEHLTVESCLELGAILGIGGDVAAGQHVTDKRRVIQHYLGAV